MGSKYNKDCDHFAGASECTLKHSVWYVLLLKSNISLDNPTSSHEHLFSP